MRIPLFHLDFLELNGIAFYSLGDYSKSVTVFKFYRNLCIFKNYVKEKMHAYKMLTIVYSLAEELNKACVYLKK